MGLVNVIVISTSSPVNDGSPPAFTLTPFTTVVLALKLGFRTVGEIASVPAVLARVAISISLSEGEFAREGTLIKRCWSESAGKTWYTSTSTSLIFSGGVPVGISPVIVALVMTVVS